MTTTTGGIAGFPAKGFGRARKNIGLVSQANAVKSKPTKPQPIVREKSHASTGRRLRNRR